MRRLAVAAAAFAALALAPTAHAWTWPASGEVLEPFVYGGDPYAGGQHRGIDVAGEREEAVLAPASGVVSFAGTVGSNGKVVTVETPGGHAVTLVHLGSIAVKKGDAVREGAAVGIDRAERHARARACRTSISAFASPPIRTATSTR